MDTSFSGMNATIYVAFTVLFTLWTISILCRRCRAYYPSSGVLPTSDPSAPQVVIPHNNAVGLFPTNQELPRGLDVSIIETFPKFPFSAGSLSGQGSEINKKVVNTKMMSGECGVCLGTFLDKELLRLLPKCGHVFHSDCVDPWLKSNATCPLCRADLLPGHLPGEMALRAEFRVNVDHGSRRG